MIEKVLQIMAGIFGVSVGVSILLDILKHRGDSEAILIYTVFGSIILIISLLILILGIFKNAK